MTVVRTEPSLSARTRSDTDEGLMFECIVCGARSTRVHLFASARGAFALCRGRCCRMFLRDREAFLPEVYRLDLGTGD